MFTVPHLLILTDVVDDELEFMLGHLFFGFGFTATEAHLAKTSGYLKTRIQLGSE